MRKYWTTRPKPLDGALVPQYGCHVFSAERTMAICQAFGRTEDEAEREAQGIIAAMVAVETRPAVAAKSKSYLMRSAPTPGHPAAQQALNDLEDGKRAGQIANTAQAESRAMQELLSASRADADLLEAYDRYFDGCEGRNKTPLSFDEWKARR